ncbi:MAG TPA: hypothetical protein VEJ89_13090 [Myxococcaceae bacterium]|nr:hypothetical protein [Myxococcaceae bacterium]
MKVLSFVIWLSWGAIITRVLLAPTVGLTLNQALVLLLLAAPAVGVLCWLRWIFRPPSEASSLLRRRQAAAEDERLDGASDWPGIAGQLF